MAEDGLWWLERHRFSISHGFAVSLESGHLFLQVDNVAEVKRPENNHSIGQFCVKISIVPNPSL